MATGELLKNNPLPTNQAPRSLAHRLGDELLELVEELVGNHRSNIDTLALVLRSSMSEDIADTEVGNAGGHVGDEGGEEGGVDEEALDADAVLTGRLAVLEAAERFSFLSYCSRSEEHAHKAARIQVAVKNLTSAEGRMMQGSCDGGKISETFERGIEKTAHLSAELKKYGRADLGSLERDLLANLLRTDLRKRTKESVEGSDLQIE